MPIFFSGINSLADILDIAVACHPLISFFFLSLLCFQAVFRIFILLRRCLGLLQCRPYAHSDWSLSMTQYSTDPRQNAFLCSQIYFSTNSFNIDSGKASAVSGIRPKFGAEFENSLRNTGFNCYWDEGCAKMWALYGIWKENDIRNGDEGSPEFGILVEKERECGIRILSTVI